jgi:S-adenosylmethionine hydrolase
MIVSLTTDFGTRDGYVGELKGVLLDRAPDALPVDVTHDVPPGDVLTGSWVLARIWARFPPGTVHLVVVDPGVGSDRRPVAISVGNRWFVGPDNGLLTRVMEGAVPLAQPVSSDRSARVLEAARIGLQPQSDTFHGRDLFAPAAAHLAAGGAPEDLGPPLDVGELVRHPLDRPRRTADGARGVIGYVDRFGNLITDVPSAWLPAHYRVRVGNSEVRHPGTSFADVAPGEAVLIRGSAGTLEVCVREGRADVVLGVGRGDPVQVVEADADV